MIEVRGLTYAIRQATILHDIHMTVRQGEMIGLIGPNGSGKTTLLKSIAHLHHLPEKTIWLKERPIETYARKELARWMSVVFQDTSVAFDFTAEEIVQMGQYAHKSPKTEAGRKEERARIDEAFAKLEIEQLRTRSILEMSGGQRQLVMIAKMFVQQTPIYLLDEPISALDIYYQLLVLQLLREESEKGKTILIVLHDLNLAARFCTTLALLKEGEIVQVGAPKEVLKESLLMTSYDVVATVEKNETVDAYQMLAIRPRKEE